MAADDLTKAEMKVRCALHRPMADETEALDLLIAQAEAAVHALSVAERRYLSGRARAVLRGQKQAFTPELAKLVVRLEEATRARKLKPPKRFRSAKL